MKRSFAIALSLGFIPVLLSGCAGVVHLESAERANTVECANMTVRLPERVADLERRDVDAQATAAWGDPAAVIIRCGLPQPGPTALPCVTVGGVDWIVDDSDRPRYVFRTFGLDPATEVIVDSEVVSGSEALRDLSGAVGSQSAANKQCLAATDVFEEG